MIEIVLGVIVFLLLVVLIYGYSKYYKDPVVCPVCSCPTCPGCPVYDLTSICDITNTRLGDTSSLLTGVSLTDISSSPDLQSAMLSFCDDAYIAKNICPSNFSTYETTYNSLCSTPATAPVLSSSRKYRVSFRDAKTGETTTKIIDTPQGAAAASASGNSSVTDAVTGKTITPDDLRNETDKSKSDRESNKKKERDMCKIKKTLNSCVCAEGTTSGTKSWNISYQKRDGTSCSQTPEIQAKIACENTPPIPCSCK